MTKPQVRWGGRFSSKKTKPNQYMKLIRTLASVAFAAALGMTGFSPSVAMAQETPATPAAAPAAETATPAPAATEAPKEEAKKEPTTDEKVADILQYFNNMAPSATGPLHKVAGPGHNAFMMVCAALVLFMTLPGLALFYGGLVRRKNVLSVCAQCLGIAGMVTILWWAVGYSLVFGTNFSTIAPALSPFLGGTEFFLLDGVGAAPNTTYTAWPSQSVFAMYQLMFAIITPALIIGAIAERMKFKAIMLFVFLWMFVVYFPMAHMVWGGTGFLNGVWNGDAKVPAIDFAGGTVVHMTSGWSALVLCIILGKRIGFGKEKMSPHSMVLCMVGTGMLWVGWYGFNAGSALAADGVAGNAFLTTTLAAGTAGFVWAMTEWLLKGHPSILGSCSGIVAGLVVVTPACGFIDANGAMIIGLAAGLVCYLFVMVLKAKFGFDDALDTFGVHAVGGTLGALLTGVLATSSANSNLLFADYAGKNGLAKQVLDAAGQVVKDAAGKDVLALDKAGLFTSQLIAIGITLAISIVATIVLAFIVKFTVGLRVDSETEMAGLDITEHGEEGYNG
jgi:Amt family ammonium transporter